MRWRLHHLPGYRISRQERVLTLDGGRTRYAWTPWDDETVQQWMQDATVRADDPDEAERRFAEALPRCLREIDENDSVDAMMSFLRGSQHRDPAGHPMSRWHGAPHLSQDMDVPGRGMRVTRGESPVDSGEIDEVGLHLGKVVSRLCHRVAAFFGGRRPR